MKVQILGTGSADRLPNPWCRCPRCTVARLRGECRNRTSVLVDDVLVIDPGPDLGAHGVDLSQVRTVLITHAHPDHLDPAFLLAWAWVDGPELVVAGPAQALDSARPWVGPDAPVRWHPLVAGDELVTDTLTVRALPAAHSTSGGPGPDGSALLYEVRGDATLLHASDTGSLPHADLRGPYDLVTLECTFGDWTGHGTAHLDLPKFGAEVARLRADRHLNATARIVAVHLSHHTPADLSDRLAPIGAEVVADGTVIEVGEPEASGAAAAKPRGRHLLVTGGARSGKSARAEALLAARPSVTYVATAAARPDDPEWDTRVRAHQERRPAHWRTVEDPGAGLPALLREAADRSAVLVDCLTLWLTGRLDAADAWTAPELAHRVAREAGAALVSALSATTADVVLVTNEVGSGVVPATVSGRLFQDLLGRLNATVAAVCDDAELVVAGLPLTLKGTPWTEPN